MGGHTLHLINLVIFKYKTNVLLDMSKTTEIILFFFTELMGAHPRILFFYRLNLTILVLYERSKYYLEDVLLFLSPMSLQCSYDITRL